MKKIINKVYSLVLCGSMLFSLMACDDSDSNGGGTNGNSVTMREQIYTDGVHVYEYTETDKYLLQNGATDYKVVISSNPTAIEKQAYLDLVSFFEEATGVTLTVVLSDSLMYSEGNKVICLGQNAYYDAALENDSALSTEGKNLGLDGFMIETVGNGIFIFGDYDYGALYGVYRYLAIEFDFDYYSGTAYYLDTGVKDVSLKDFSVIDIPDYKFRDCQYSHITYYSPADYRMGFNKGSGFAINSNSAHTAFIYLPKETYQTIHPKWYSTDNTQLCYYARGDEVEYEAMLNQMLEIMKQSFRDDDGYFFRIGHWDSLTWCNCDACTASLAKHGANSASVIIFANKLVKKMDAWLATDEGKPYARDYRVTVLAYGPSSTLAPPARYNEATAQWEPTSSDVICHDRVIPWYAPLEIDYNYTIFEKNNQQYLNYFYGWKSLCKEMSFYLYSTNYKNYLIPSAFFEQLQGMYQLGAAAGGYYVHDLGQRTQSGGATGWHVFKAYLISKLSWNVNLDIGELTKKFFRGYFGVAADTMLEFYESYRVHAEYTVNNVYAAGVSVYMPLLDVRYWPKSVLDNWNRLVEKALSEIEVLKKVDMNAYQRYYDNITMERVSLYYMMVELYSNFYSETFVQQMKLSFKEDCNRLGITATGEGNGKTVDSVLKSWGV